MVGTNILCFFQRWLVRLWNPFISIVVPDSSDYDLKNGYDYHFRNFVYFILSFRTVSGN